jgi:hypothetical protein
MSETIHLELPYIAASQAQKHVTHNEALRILDALVMLSVKDRDLSAPPGSPADGDRYLVKPAGSGGFAGKDNQIAHFRDGAWTFHTPRSGWLCYVEDEELPLVYDGSAWVSLLGDHAAFQNVTLLGVGTEADGSNPFAAKLNNVLWTALYDAEGGDGSLRYKLNKEDVADTLSLLLQTDWSGRAEIGLTGSDNLRVKVSADGSVWKDAVSVSNTSGHVGIGGATNPVNKLHVGDENSASVSSLLYTADVMSVSAQGANAASINLISANTNAAFAGFFKATRSRGTLSSPAAVQTGDDVFALLGVAIDGTTWRASAGITFKVDGTVTDNVQAPQAIIFGAGNSSATERARINSSGNMGIGTASPDEKLTVAGIVDPGADNTYTIGKSGRRWSAIWAANGTIQTSDARDKRDVAASDLGLDFIMALRPISYRFAIGGNEEVIETVEVEAEEYVYGEEQRTVVVVDVVNGKAVRSERVETVRVPLFDDIPVVDEAGRPVSDPEGTPQVLRVPRVDTVTREQQIVGYRERPGRRRHYGLSAQQVRKVLDDLGVEDFAGWVKTDPDDPASDEALRYDQFIAPLIRAVQQLTERVAALEARQR